MKLETLDKISRYTFYASFFFIIISFTFVVTALYYNSGILSSVALTFSSLGTIVAAISLILKIKWREKVINAKNADE